MFLNNTYKSVLTVIFRSNDGAFASLPLNGKEDVVDMDFFRAHSLPLIKLAVKDFLKVDVLELTPLANVIFGTSTLRPKVSDFAIYL